MKKLISVFIAILIFSICVVGCDKSDVVETTTSTKTQEEQSKMQELTKKQETNLFFEETTQGDIGGGEIVQEKYRQCYYRISYQFAQLVDKTELRAWKEETFVNSPNDTNEMIMKLFVQDFNISREDFDKANAELAKWVSETLGEVAVMNPKDYVNQEMFEVYNSDIIYTFDDEIINEYYLGGDYPYVYEDDYVNDVLNGTYKTRTTEFYYPEKDNHSSVQLRGYIYETETTSIVSETETTAQAE